MTEDLGFDPRLKAAVEEIKEIAERYDVAGAVFLVSPTHSEYFYNLPSWSVLRFEQDPANPENVGLRFRTMGEDFANKASQEAATGATVHMVEHLRGLSAKTFEMFHMIMEMIEEHFEIDRKPLKHRPGKPQDAQFAERFRQPRRPERR